MQAAPGNAQLGGLRREHVVASAIVAAVTVVLGFASGFGVRDAGAAGAAPAGPVVAPAAPPGAVQAGPPAAAAAAAGAARPQVAAWPGGHGAGGHGSGGPGTRGPGFAAGGDEPAAPGVPGLAAQCPAGGITGVLGLVTLVSGGGSPGQALAVAGATGPASQPGGAVVALGVLPGAADLTTLLRLGDRVVPVTGLVPLLDTVAQRQQARAARQNPLPLPLPAPGPGPGPAPVVMAPGAPALTPGAGDPLAQLAALLAPLGLGLDLVTGITDPLLTPVLGSVGCTGMVPAGPQGAGR